MTRKLHIGGTCKTDGWEVLNAQAAPYVDHVRDAKDLSTFGDNTFSHIYASHIVEHFDFKDELHAALKEWNRVLMPGGTVYISVPDMDTLSRLVLQRDKLSIQDRFFVMQMLFGGHKDAYDYHSVGLTDDFLASFLQHSGFVKIFRVSHFGLFDDSSTLEFKGVPISLNMIAEKPGK